MNENKNEDVIRIIETILEKMKISTNGDLTQSISRKVRSISPKLSLQLKFSKLEKLVPIVIYLELRLRGYVFSKGDLTKYSSLTHEELHHFLIQLIHFTSKFR